MLLRVPAVVAALSAIMPSPAAADILTLVGGCTLEIRLTASPPADVSGTPTSLSFTGSGACVVNDVLTVGTFNGVAASPPLVPWSCAAGVATGTALFDTAHPSMATQTVTVELVVSAETMTVTARFLPYFTGAGAFVQTAPVPSTCPTGASQTTTVYTGAFAFEDPVVT